MAKSRPHHKRFKARERRPSGYGEGWIYGHHAVAAALANPARDIVRVLATTSAAEKIADNTSGWPITITTREDIESHIGSEAVHQGIAAEVKPLPPRSIEDIAEEAGNSAQMVVIALDQASDPRNIGAVLRSAAAFGVAALIQQDRNAPPVTGALAKAASGGIEKVALVSVTNIVRALETLKKAGFWVVGLDGTAPQTLDEADLPEKCCLVLGSEGGGLRRLTSEACDLAVRIPIHQSAESLNLSNAAAIAMYELGKRQRKQ
jgi:23S rRNA (guanosine2251-2'-O)-methyltransferase